MVMCPSCGRPRALARATCVYCGALLPAAPDAAREPAGLEPTPDPAAGRAPSRWLVVLDLANASEDTVRRALERPPYDVRLLVRRGGLHLHRILEDAEAEARRLEAVGVRAFLIPETEARVRPVRALGGEEARAALALRTEEGRIDVRRDDVLLVVTGPITREYQPSSRRRRVDTSRLDDGYRVHIHRRSAPRPVEIDAASFEPGFAITGSARLEVEAWIRALAGDAPHDDGFRHLPPALAPAEPEPKGALSVAGSLERARRGAEGGRDDRTVLLDNVEQFRFYSGWRAAVERRRSAP
jgi:hypothetical protein